jgi:hypothetical protein
MKPCCVNVGCVNDSEDFGLSCDACLRKSVDRLAAIVLPAEARKQRPVYSGVLRYFPDALMAVAHCSWAGNEQHNPGEPLYWNRAKSTDEADALVRHLLQAGTVDTDGVRHSAKVAWRALALLQKELEAAGQTL